MENKVGRTTFETLIAGATSEVTDRDIDTFRKEGSSPRREGDQVIGEISNDTLRVFLGAQHLINRSNEIGLSSEAMPRDSAEWKEARDRAFTLKAQGQALADHFWNRVRCELSTEGGPNLWHGNDIKLSEGGVLIIPAPPAKTVCRCGNADCPNGELIEALAGAGEDPMMTLLGALVLGGVRRGGRL